MPFNTAQLASGANVSLETYRRTDPIDQISQERPFLNWLMRNKEATVFGNGYVNEPVYVAHDSNYQNYFGADQVTYNERDPVRQAKFGYYNFHDGFWFDEDRLAANGIILTDDREAVATGAEKIQLVNLLQTSYRALKEGVNDNFNLEALQNGAASTKAMPGLAHLVSTTPNVGTVGNINAATAPYWQNNANLAIAEANLIAEMEETWRAVTRYGGMRPDFIVVGAAFLDAYRKVAGDTINRQIVVNGRGGASLDASVSGLYFKGVELIHDPSFEDLDVLNPGETYPWTKRAYFLNSRTLKLRPMQGHWMVNRRPERLPDRYVHYFGLTSKYGMSINKRNANAVLSVA
jgi:hypothetical protein